MGRSQRTKGATGEREVVAALQARGHHSRRTAPMQTGYGGTHGDADVAGLPGYHIEVKRQEALSLDKWSAQAEADASVTGNVPLVVYRRSRQPWRVALTLDAFLDLYELAHGKDPA